MSVAVGDICHNRFSVWPEGSLECLYRIEMQVARCDIGGRDPDAPPVPVLQLRPLTQPPLLNHRRIALDRHRPLPHRGRTHATERGPSSAAPPSARKASGEQPRVVGAALVVQLAHRRIDVGWPIHGRTETIEA